MSDTKGYCMMKCALDCLIGYDERFDPIGYHKIEAALNEGNHIYPIFDFAVDGNGLMILNTQGPTCLIMVNSMDSVRSWFKCDESCGVLIPPGIDNEVQKMFEASKRLTRKGGYGNIVRNMVILSSLRKGEFNDDFLFSKYVNENDE